VPQGGPGVPSSARFAIDVEHAASDPIQADRPSPFSPPPSPWWPRSPTQIVLPGPSSKRPARRVASASSSSPPRPPKLHGAGERANRAHTDEFRTAYGCCHAGGGRHGLDGSVLEAQLYI